MAREMQALKPSGGEHGYRHREHRSKAGRKKRDRFFEEKMNSWWSKKGNRKLKKKWRRFKHELVSSFNSQ